MRGRAALLLFYVACAAACGRGDPAYDYVPCDPTTTCTEPATCHTITWRDGSGGLCTAPCVGPRECPHLGRCLDVSASGTFLCYEPCAVDTDCPTRFVCQPLSTGGAVCLPL